MNVKLKITIRFNSNLEKLNNSHQEGIKTKNISDFGATVVYRKSGCSYFILQSSQRYIVAEWFGGRDPDIGEVLLGYSIHSDLKIWLQLITLTSVFGLMIICFQKREP